MAVYNHFTISTDDASPLVSGQTYAANQVATVTIPATGVFVDSTGDTATNGDTVFVQHPTGGVIAADAASITPAEFLLLNMVDAPTTGKPSAEWLQHSALSEKDGYLPLTGSNLTVTDGTTPLGTSPRVYASHIVCAVGVDDNRALTAGTHRLSFYVANHTTGVLNVGNLAAGNIAYRILDVTTGLLTASAVAADSGAATIAIENWEDLGNGQYCFDLVLYNPADFNFRIGAYAIDSVATWEADMVWFVEMSDTSATATYTGLQLVDSAIPLDDSQTTVPSRFFPEGTPPYLLALNDQWVDWNTGLDLTNVDYIEAEVSGNNFTNNVVSKVAVQTLRDTINNGNTIDIGAFDWVGTTRLRLRVGSIADLNAGVLQFASNTSSAMFLQRLTTWANAENGFVIPSGTVVDIENPNRISRNGNSNPGDGNPFQHGTEILNEGDITYAAGVYTINTPATYSIRYGMESVLGSGVGFVSAALFINGVQTGSGVGLVNDSSSNFPFGGSSEFQVALTAGDVIEFRQTGTPGFGGTNKTTSISINQLSTGTFVNPDFAAIPTSFTDLGNWNGVNLQTLVTNGVITGDNTGQLGTGAPSAAFNGSVKITAIGDWIQQDFISSNSGGTDLSERFSRQSFNGGTTWTGWFGQ